MTRRFVLNETSYFGAGSREAIAEEVARKGLKKALIVRLFILLLIKIKMIW